MLPALAARLIWSYFRQEFGTPVTGQPQHDRKHGWSLQHRFTYVCPDRRECRSGTTEHVQGNLAAGPRWVLGQHCRQQRLQSHVPRRSDVFLL